MKRYSKAFAWVAFLAISVTIFGFSHQSAEQSSKVSQSVLHEILLRIHSGYAGMEPVEQVSVIAIYHTWIRSAAHFSLYMIWGFTLSILLKTYQFGRKKLFITVLTAGSTYAILDEIHQLFLKGRSAQLADVFTDVCGVLTGLGCFLAIGICYGRLRYQLFTKKNN